uniref:Uncharacterized protein n=1 Tax=Megaselia scalaris TaxID=36166 RepID=T1GXN1_MEGSC
MASLITNKQEVLGRWEDFSRNCVQNSYFENTNQLPALWKEKLGDEELLTAFDRRTLRIIYGSVCEEG